MNKVFLYNAESIAPKSKTIEELYKNYIFENSLISINSFDEFDKFSSFVTGSIDWTEYPNNSKFSFYKIKSITTSMLSNLFKKSNIKKIDQIICILAPMLSDLDSELKKNTPILEFLPELEFDDYLVSELLKHEIEIKKEQIQIIDNTCTSGNCLIGYAFQGIKLNFWKSVLVIAVDLIDPFNLHVLNSLGALANSDLTPEKMSRPFDFLRSGFIKSDGAACAILTSESSVEDISLAEVLSFSQTSDAHKLTDGREDCAAIIKAMNLSIEKAGLDKEDIDIIKTHGTGTRLNDQHEAKAIDIVFSSNKNQPLVTSLKGLLGHFTDASGLVENSLFCYALKKNSILGTYNLENTEFKNNFLIKNIKKMKFKKMHILSNTLGFGGNNSCLVLKA